MAVGTPRFEMTAHSPDSTLTDSGSAIPMRRSDPSSGNVKAAAPRNPQAVGIPTR